MSCAGCEYKNRVGLPGRLHRLILFSFFLLSLSPSILLFLLYLSPELSSSHSPFSFSRLLLLSRYTHFLHNHHPQGQRYVWRIMATRIHKSNLINRPPSFVLPYFYLPYHKVTPTSVQKRQEYFIIFISSKQSKELLSTPNNMHDTMNSMQDPHLFFAYGRHHCRMSHVCVDEAGLIFL